MKLMTFPLILLAMMLTLGCSTSPKSEEGKANLHDDINATMNRFKREDPGLDAFLNHAYGYAMFPSVGKGAVGVGGAYGRGEVYEQGKLIGYSDLSQATVGLQLGGQEYAELIVFENQTALDRFTHGNFAFSANASAVALKAGAAAATTFRDGVAVFTQAKGGLMFEASIGGQKFGYQAIR